jgi:hypothetical protein
MLNITHNNINLFNEKIIEYFCFLEKIIVDVYAKNKIKTYINKIRLGSQINNKMIVDLFYEKIYPHNIKIKNEDEDVFDIFKIHLFDNKLDLKNLWSTIEENDKETIWKYLKIFVLICEQK